MELHNEANIYMDKDLNSKMESDIKDSDFCSLIEKFCNTEKKQSS